MVYKKAVSVSANTLEVLKVMDNESFREEEAAFFDVKRAKIGERRQIHLLQLHDVSSSACNPQTLNRWQAVLAHTYVRNGWYCSQAANTIVGITATHAVLLGKQNTWRIHKGMESRFRWTLSIQIHCVTKSGNSHYGLVGERKCWLVVAPGRSVSEHRCQSIRVLRHQLSQEEKDAITTNWGEIGNVYSSLIYSLGQLDNSTRFNVKKALNLIAISSRRGKSVCYCHAIRYSSLPEKNRICMDNTQEIAECFLDMSLPHPVQSISTQPSLFINR